MPADLEPTPEQLVGATVTNAQVDTWVDGRKLYESLTLKLADGTEMLVTGKYDYPLEFKEVQL